MPRNWLNIFTAVRNANQFEADQQQQIVENKRADEQLGFQRNQDMRAQAGEDRTATDWDTDRATRTTLGALGAYTNMVDSINNSSIPEAERPQAYAAAFDRIAPALQASGYDPQRVDALRAQLIENPDSASDLLSGLQSMSANGGSQPNLQAAFGPDGQAVFINPRTGRVAARGYAPATAVLGRDRVTVSEGNLSQRQLENDPDHVFDVGAARAEGGAAGEAAQGLPSARAAIARSAETVDRILEADPETLQSILGVPTLQGLFRGGAGAFGSIPGTESADLAADVQQSLSQARLAAYESLRGGGHITEAESLFGAQAWTNLTRTRSLPAFQAELRRFRANLQRADEILQQTAAPSRNPNRTPAPAAPARQRATPADVDAILRERGF